MGSARRAAFWVVLAAMLCGAAAASELDRCSVVVTGTDMRERPGGLARCLTQVLVKVSGDPGVADDARTEAVTERAAGLVEDFAYFDRMSDTPMHDEQGSRDRPFDLAVRFDPAKVDAALAELGRKPWRLARPTLAVAVSITGRTGEVFPLVADTLAGERQREAVFAAGERFGLRVILFPAADAPAADAASAEIAARAARTVASAPVAALSGTLTWSASDYGWVGRWRLARPDGEHAWEARGVSFDEAFRNAVSGSAAILAREAAH